MVRTQKNRRSKSFQYDKNRKNLKKKINSTGKIKCPAIRRGLDRKKGLATNIKEMGLVYDVKKNFRVESFKEKHTKQAKTLKNGFVEEDIEPTKFAKQHVLDKLEEEANVPKESKFKLPKCQVKELGYFIDKYGLNYKLWAKDHKNYDQITWRQYRAKCRKLMNIPEQFSQFLEARDLLEADISPEDVKWKEYCSEDDD